MEHDSQQTISSRVPAWFERKFAFTFPAEQYPNLCIRLRGTPARLEEMVRGIAHDVLLNKPGNKWSAQEHVGHLYPFDAASPPEATDAAGGSLVLCCGARRSSPGKNLGDEVNFCLTGKVNRLFGSMGSSLSTMRVCVPEWWSVR